jgi:1-acyl-sn-glycerol-3-phosphate acyltransferase
LIVANHLSYLDIILLIEFAHGRIPPPKFFLKKELIWLPFVGLGAWALDMPFMRRYSQAFIAKNPHLRGKDIETTRKSCEKFKSQPTTVINFVEGTRFTDEKHQQKNSPFECLLPPKAGGIAFTLAAMGELFTNILDVSIAYPQNRRHPMFEMLSGQMTHIVIDVRVLEVNDDVIGDYFNNNNFKQRFQQWLNDLWHTKDQRLKQLLGC